ncbi:MAG: hypothetical protein VKJ46_08300 [Leptolyngbyaceae bacterium]|nr:hypothetical protein [Leptolyngbyaceae bacterium]
MAEFHRVYQQSVQVIFARILAQQGVMPLQGHTANQAFIELTKA